MLGPSSYKPRIGITAWRRPLPTPIGERTDLFTLSAEYVDAVRQAGGLPLILPHSSDPEPFLDLMDGLLMSGGGGVHPHSYGAEDDPGGHQLNPEADRWEIDLVRAAAARRMPVFGIGRGMQIMAVAFGGKLQQEIPAAVRQDRQRVELAAGSTCAAAYGATSRRVAAIHGQTVMDAGIFAVTARSDGGDIEAIEASPTWPAFGVHWHPERMQEPDEMRAEHALFRCFVDRAVAYARARVI